MGLYCLRRVCTVPDGSVLPHVGLGKGGYVLYQVGLQLFRVGLLGPNFSSGFVLVGGGGNVLKLPKSPVF